jgi:hypothetical protein
MVTLYLTIGDLIWLDDNIDDIILLTDDIVLTFRNIFWLKGTVAWDFSVWSDFAKNTQLILWCVI